MALVTRCPNCTSVFKVTPQHLQMQEGNVRCGHCLQIFNSFSDLATLQEEVDADKPLELSIESKEAKYLQLYILIVLRIYSTFLIEPSRRKVLEVAQTLLGTRYNNTSSSSTWMLPQDMKALGMCMGTF